MTSDNGNSQKIYEDLFNIEEVKYLDFIFSASSAKIMTLK